VLLPSGAHLFTCSWSRAFSNRLPDYQPKIYKSMYSTNVKYCKILEIGQKTNYTNNESTALLNSDKALSERSMTDSDTDPVLLRKQLVENYHKLSALEQVIVQLFSVIYEPVSRAAFAICLNQTGTRDKTVSFSPNKPSNLTLSDC
jgi:hypothetical protein